MISENDAIKAIQLFRPPNGNIKMTALGPTLILENSPVIAPTNLNLVCQEYPIILNCDLNQVSPPIDADIIASIPFGIEILIQSDSLIDRSFQGLSRNQRSSLTRALKKYDSNRMQFEITSDIDVLQEWYIEHYLPTTMSHHIDPYGFNNILVFLKNIEKYELAYIKCKNSVLGGFLIRQNRTRVDIDCISSRYIESGLSINDLILYHLCRYHSENTVFSLGVDSPLMSGSYLNVFAWKTKWKGKVEPVFNNYSIYLISNITTIQNQHPILVASWSDSKLKFMILPIFHTENTYNPTVGIIKNRLGKLYDESITDLRGNLYEEKETIG